MLNKSICKLNEQFIKEAKESPQLLEDMAAMEKYMAESYAGRVFVELLQNAEDCGSTRVKMFEYNGDIIFANNGTAFSEDDIRAISRSGASKKERGTTIGYRGIGFKSTTYMTNEIIIYSNSTYFTFSKSICAQNLNIEEHRIPTIRIPFLVNDIEWQIEEIVGTLTKDGYSTIFIFRKAEIEGLVEELSEVKNGYFIFLNNIECCDINVRKCISKFKISRKNKNDYLITSIVGNTKEQWIVIKKSDIQLAFKYAHSRIIPCEEDEAVYHCYLPTLDKMNWPFKVNSDFSTDPSRKHLTLDELTKKSLVKIGVEIFNLIGEVLNGKKEIIFDSLIEITANRTSFSKINNIVNDKVKEQVCSIKNIEIGKKTIAISEYKLLPEWLDETEQLSIRLNSQSMQESSLENKLYQRIHILDDFIKQYSSNRFSIDDMITLLGEETFVKVISTELLAKLYINIIRSAKRSQMISDKKYNLGNMCIKNKGSIYKIAEIIHIRNVELEREFVSSIKNSITDNDLEWFCSETSLNMSFFEDKVDKTESNNTEIHGLLKKEQGIMQTNVLSSIYSRISISKWRSAEQQCIEIEKMLGNIARDVSKQNVGYDIESSAPNGKKRFIEVKSVKFIGDSFSLTNNEYTAAHQYGEQYFICIISQIEDKLEYMYISNPLIKLDLQKRIRQWEWYCEQYDGDMNIISF